MVQVSFQGISSTSCLYFILVTHVLGLFCYQCIRFIPTLVLSLKGEDILLYIYFHLLPNPLPYRKREVRERRSCLMVCHCEEPSGDVSILSYVIPAEAGIHQMFVRIACVIMKKRYEDLCF